MIIDRRRLLGLAAGAGALLGAVPALAATNLTFWSWRQEDRAFYEAEIKKFTAQNPDISVTFQTYQPENYQTILSTALAGGTGPDLIHVRAYGNLETIARPGYLLPLDTASVPELANFDEAALKAESLRSDGKVYAVPTSMQAVMILYNTKIFAANGVSVPKTWDELIAACKALKAKGITPFGNGTATPWQNETVFFSFAASLLGKSFEDDILSGKADFKDPRFIEALAKVKEVSAYFAPNFTGVDYPSAQQFFMTEQAAMFAGGSFEASVFKAQNPGLDIGVFATPPLKAGDPALVARYFDGGYAINAKTTKQEAALKFLRHLSTPAYGTVFTNTLGNISPIKGITISDPLTKAVAKLDETAMSYLMLVHFRYQEPSGSVLLQAQMQKMLSGQATPAEVGETLTKGIATYFKPFQK